MSYTTIEEARAQAEERARNHNPAAFPYGDPTNGGDDGMTLRDYFAAKAMQALITRIAMSGVEVTERAYCIADAMLKAREQ